MSMHGMSRPRIKDSCSLILTFLVSLPLLQDCSTVEAFVTLPLNSQVFALRSQRAVWQRPFTLPEERRTRSSRWKHAAFLTMNSPSNDEDFESWYQKEKQFTLPGGKDPRRDAGPHAVGDVIVGGGNRWSVVAETGTDGLAWTYEAIGETGDMKVQLQVLSLRGMRGSWQGLDEFQQRERLYRSLSHPGILSMAASFEVDSPSDKLYYLALAQPPGQSLESLLLEGWRPTEEDVTAMGLQLLDIVEYLQRLRPPVQHLNISPRTVLVAPALLRDPGAPSCWLAGFAPSPGAAPSLLSEGYLPPSASSAAPPLSADVFGVGALLLRAVSGADPARFLSPTPAPRSLRDQVYVSRGLGEVIEGMLGSEQASPFAASFPTLRAARLALRTATADPDQPLALEPAPQAGEGRGGSAVRVRARRPLETKVELSVSDSRLEVVVPGQGLSAGTLSIGGFTVAWNAVVGTWTLTAITGGAPLLFTAFSIPFWLAGAGLAKDTFRAGFVSTRLTINRGTFSLVEEAVGRQRTVAQGQTRDLRGSAAEPSVESVLQDGQVVWAVRIVAGDLAFSIGKGLSEAEVSWMSSAINDFLSKDVTASIEAE